MKRIRKKITQLGFNLTIKVSVITRFKRLILFLDSETKIKGMIYTLYRNIFKQKKQHELIICGFICFT